MSPQLHGVCAFSGGRLASGLYFPKRGLGSKFEMELLSAAAILGTRTMMEGGALGAYTREQIEAFCQERLIGKLWGAMAFPEAYLVSRTVHGARIGLPFPNTSTVCKLRF